MGYRNLRQCVDDLERTGHLVRMEGPVDPRFEAAEIQRRLYANRGPAVLLTNPIGCRFPLLCNLFGTAERARYLFRDTLDAVRKLIELKADWAAGARRPWGYAKAARLAMAMVPRMRARGPVFDETIRVSDLPRIQSWPLDGGPFITLPQVYSEDVERPGWAHSNLGMYRVQLGGNAYRPDAEIGIHYQLHRGIGIHHSIAMRRDQPFRVHVWVGGSPAMMLAAVMPLPENMPEVAFAGALAGHRIPLVRQPSGPPVYAEADFCVTGVIDPGKTLPEGPFGDHLGYYSLAHPFPVLRVERVTRRRGAIWPFTVVGRPPQEDTVFAELIHELSAPVLPTLVHGVREVRAVDEAGVHPLMLAIGSERYAPYRKLDEPQEILTQANAILGHGQMSLSKYLLIVDGNENTELRATDIRGFFRHWLERIDWQRDVHFQTATTIDTLDYTGDAIHRGSKVVLAAAGPPRRRLVEHVAPDLNLPSDFNQPRIALPGVLVVRGPTCRRTVEDIDPDMARFCGAYRVHDAINAHALIVVVDDSLFTARDLRNFLWVVFTRSNPAADIHGIGPFVRQKHWGCEGSLVIDARSKPHHAPALEPDAETARRVDAVAARGGPLARFLQRAPL
ncbi:MAG: UbiD family decarboxylase [Planctomycetes bacterium]|nr:UbiD family decarboxylase [Planctomycetota bacterium]